MRTKGNWFFNEEDFLKAWGNDCILRKCGRCGLKINFVGWRDLLLVLEIILKELTEKNCNGKSFPK